MILFTMTGNFIGWACWDVHACYVRGATSPSHSACWLPINERDTGRKRDTYVPNSFHTHMLAI